MEKDHKQLWAECCRFIHDNIPQRQYDAWFSNISSVDFTDNKLTLLVPSSYFVDQLEERYLNVLGAAIRKVCGSDVNLIYRYYSVESDPKSVIDQASARPSSAITQGPGRNNPANPFQPQTMGDFDSQLNARYTFENYLPSNCNNLARTIGESIANNEKIKTFNPFFIFGSTGVGKTHLIQAIGVRIKERNPQARVIYVTSRLFESQYTAAVKKGTTNNFFHFYQSMDTLIIDDVQDLKGKPSTQNTFFHIFNHLHNNNKQIIMSSDCAPADMDGFEERLLQRFKWGASARLSKPDLTLRRDVLKQKAQQDGLSLPADVIEYIAQNITESIRELEGAVVSLVAHATVLNHDIDMSIARVVVANAVKINRKKINFEMITEAVSQHYGIEPDSLFTKSRRRDISDPRQLVMYLAKKVANMPLKSIGRRIDRTHATVIHAVKSIEERIPIEKKLAEDVAAIEAQLGCQ